MLFLSSVLLSVQHWGFRQAFGWISSIQHCNIILHCSLIGFSQLNIARHEWSKASSLLAILRLTWSGSKPYHDLASLTIRIRMKYLPYRPPMVSGYGNNTLGTGRPSLCEALPYCKPLKGDGLILTLFRGPSPNFLYILSLTAENRTKRHPDINSTCTMLVNSCVSSPFARIRRYSHCRMGLLIRFETSQVYVHLQ